MDRDDTIRRAIATLMDVIECLEDPEVKGSHYDCAAELKAVAAEIDEVDPQTRRSLPQRGQA